MSQLLGKLDLNLLRAFDSIYSTRNISRAAQEIGLSQPAMSNALSRLRETLGDPLFLREARGVTPTARAEEMITTVRRILADAEKIISGKDLFDLRTSERQFRLCMVDAFEPLVMPALIAAAREGSGIQFQLLQSSSTNVDDALHSGSVDLVVNLPLPMHRDLYWDILAPLELVVVARKGHKQVQGSITPAQLMTLPHVALDLTPGRMANAHLLRLTQRLTVNATVLVGRVGAITDTVAVSDLIGITPRLHAEFSPAVDHLQILPLPWKANDQNYVMTWHKRTEQDAGLIWLRDVLRTAIAGALAAKGPKEERPMPRVVPG